MRRNAIAARLIAAALLVLACAPRSTEAAPPWSGGQQPYRPPPAADAGGPRLPDSEPTLPRDFFVGRWEARVIEQGKDVRIVWTMSREGQSSYQFDLGKGLERGSTGTWAILGNLLVEVWLKPNHGAGMGTIERVDQDTFRLTIVDNGAPEYKGLVRVYRRLGPPPAQRGRAKKR